MFRRQFLREPVLSIAGAIAISTRVNAQGTQVMPEELVKRYQSPLFIATWPFGLAACRHSLEVYSQSGSLLDAVEQGINVTELDPAVDSVGIGGRPNSAGVMQFDACLMDGRTQQAGAVAAIEGFPNAISVARRVMETTPHVMLVGQDATNFALQNGFKRWNSVLTADAQEAWQQWKSRQAENKPAIDKSHDTIALLGLGSDGQLVGGCSTSGRAFKLPGRVGDSPIIGSGLYVDGEVGAAGATGIGENVMRYCSSYLIVELMRLGKTPAEACQIAIQRIVAGEKRPIAELHVNFVAINKAGEVGAAGTSEDFLCAIATPNLSTVAQPLIVK